MKKQNFFLNPCLFSETFLNYFRSVIVLRELFFFISLLFYSGLIRSTTYVKMRGVFSC